MKKLRNDLILIACVLLVAALLWCITRPGDNGVWVVVTLDGREVGRYALSEDSTMTFGEKEYNVLQILAGKAAVMEANCGDHTCVRTGEIFRDGETIVCLPHKLVIAVEGGAAADFDAVVK